MGAMEAFDAYVNAHVVHAATPDEARWWWALKIRAKRRVWAGADPERVAARYLAVLIGARPHAA